MSEGDLSQADDFGAASPGYSGSAEATLQALPEAVYLAWTTGFDTWFASAGAIRMRPVEGEPFWLEVTHNGVRHPHYGRFLTLDPSSVIALTWVSGRGGTDGAETTLRIKLSAVPAGTRVLLPTPVSSRRRRRADTEILGHRSWPISTRCWRIAERIRPLRLRRRASRWHTPLGACGSRCIRFRDTR
jgi:uncharacterized protein YndB with AHSA1/START domain